MPNHTSLPPPPGFRGVVSSPGGFLESLLSRAGVIERIRPKAVAQSSYTRTPVFIHQKSKGLLPPPIDISGFYTNRPQSVQSWYDRFSEHGSASLPPSPDAIAVFGDDPYALKHETVHDITGRLPKEMVASILALPLAKRIDRSLYPSDVEVASETVARAMSGQFPVTMNELTQILALFGGDKRKSLERFVKRSR